MTTSPDAAPTRNDVQSDAQPDRLLGQLRWNLSLSAFQTFVGVAAGVISIVGAVLAVASFFKPAPPPPTKGQIVAIIEEAQTASAITDARVEVLTPKGHLVTTVTPNYFGKARHDLEEGPYQIRVSHPQYRAEMRPVVIVKGETAEVHIKLRQGSSSPLAGAERVLKEGVGAVKRIFGE
jgi:hypothetical protein